MSEPLRILHLEDNPDYSELVKAMLEKEGQHVEMVQVDNLADFIAALEKQPFDVILGDYKLPDCNGLQALQNARQKRPATPFLLVSGTIGEQAAIESLKCGATDYVLKQWPERLVPTVRRAVQEALERAQRKQMETELLRRERYFRALTENSLDILTILNREGVFQHNSPSVKHILGYEPEELAGENAFSLVHPDDFQVAMRAFEQALEDPDLRVTQELRFRRKDGSWCQLEVVGQNRLDDPEIAGVVLNSRDITARKQAEEALRRSELSLRESQRVARVGSYVLDIPTGCWVSSPILNDILGIGESHEKTVASWIAIVHPDEREKILAYFAEVLVQKKRFEIEYRVVRRNDGQERWVLDLGELAFDAAGRPVRMAGVIQDITERKGAEVRLRLQGTALEAAANVIVITDRDGNIIWINPAFTRVTGYAAEEVLGQNPRLLKSGKHDDAFYKNLWDTILAGQVWNAEIVNRRKDGSLYTEDCTVTPVRNEQGLITHFIAVKQDITARKQAEEVLRQNEEYLRALTENAMDVISVLNPDGTIRYESPSVKRVLGYTPEELVGKNVIDLVHPEDKLSIRDVFRVGTPKPGLAVREEVRFRHNDGSWRMLEVIGRNLFHDPSVRGVVVNSRDITERKQLEAQFRQAQKMEAMGQLAGGVAHDLNNLLTVIRGNTDLVLMNAGQLTVEAGECLKQVTAASDRAANLTRQLLAFGRKQVLRAQPLEPNELVANLTKLLTRVIGEDIRLECRYAERLPFVQADPGMMEQVLMNLVVNARDAMLGGGQLLIATQKAGFDSAYVQAHPEARVGEFVCLSVSDTGTGIAPEHLPRIFEPFFTTKELGKGTGLGLATVHGIVQQHSGWIEVESKLGEGTTFKVCLPASPASPGRPEAQVAEKALRGGTETILVVEDEAPVRELTCKFLASRGYKILQAADGVAALEVWEQHKGSVDLLLTDLVMPNRINGWQLAETLWADQPDLKVVFTSGYGMEVAGKEFVVQLQKNFLQKPYTPRKLASAVRDCLDASSPANR